MMNSWKKVYKKGLLDHIESYKSNYHMITTTMVPRLAKEERGHNFLPIIHIVGCFNPFLIKCNGKKLCPLSSFASRGTIVVVIMW
jgi:hypothetical protein